MYFIYHIHHESDRGNLSEGYIGITNNPRRRWREHRNKNTSCNIYLFSKISNNDDVVFTVISQGDVEEIKRMEKWLRPCKMGWNLTEGGGLPPNLKGHTWSEETLSKRSMSMKKALEEGRATTNRPAGKACVLSKPFTLVSPEGEEHHFEAMNKEWLKERSLNVSNLYGVLNGKRKQHKGWTGHYI